MFVKPQLCVIFSSNERITVVFAATEKLRGVGGSEFRRGPNFSVSKGTI